MYIKSIVLDGFKSYGNRVEITGFDPEFNAITGLNGTGKSNILDSICFVLGITNLSNVRAGSLQELIYKHGQAGITKATVSITFDNRDKKQCPIGYENHDEITVTRQVVMGGKNKYLINGINVQNKRVADLFCSVQLNVNNPHFLIMQGRITKVLNMKPPEILSMVEEAAGTRMYEAKKQAAEKTIEKKDAKLKELNDIIKEDIAPKLQKLQDERSQYQEYQKVVRELENLTRLYVAWRYVTAEENAKEADSKVLQVKNEIQEKKDKIEDNKKKAKQLDDDIAVLNKKLDEESSGSLRRLQQALEEAERSEASSGAAAAAAAEALAALQRRAALLQRARDDDLAARLERQRRHDEAEATFGRLRSARDSTAAELERARAHYVSVSAGSHGQGEGSLQDMLMAAKQEASEASTSISQSKMELKHVEQRLKTLEKEFKSSSGQFQKDQEIIERDEAELEQLQAEVSSAEQCEGRVSSLRAVERESERECRSARDRRDQLAAALQRTNFDYTDPVSGFDRTLVYGQLCRLLTVPEPRYCTALETAAGGKLYNVVVETDAVSRQLLQRGRLASRTTFIPLNKIRAHVIDADTVRAAQHVGGGPAAVHLALQLVSVPSRVATAAQYAFGATLVCSTLGGARQVAFSSRVRRRAVTLDGDVVDPAGTLAGGARAQGGSLLLRLAELERLEAELRQLERRRDSARDELAALQLDASRRAALQQRHEALRLGVETARARLAGTQHAQLHAEVAALRERRDELTAAAAAAAERLRAAETRAAELEIQLKDIKGHRDRQFSAARSALEVAEAAAAAAARSWEEREQEAAALALELAELTAAVAAAADQLQAAAAAADAAAAERDAAKETHKRHQAEVKEIQNQIKKQKSEMASRSGSVSRLLKQKEAALSAGAELELGVQALQYRVAELLQEAKDAADKITSLESEHPWIPGERAYFGLAGGAYDWTDQPGTLAPRRKQLAERRDRLARGLNARAHALLGKEEEQYQDVMRKKKIVEADRAKLVQVMAELDEKKRRTLAAACEQVNRDFGNIFSTLLPGAAARLLPPPGASVLQGLEVKVGFNGRWKESLGELSGGQRSLVALSLVLAMLLFHPAPLYILDEVDAALDLSHTQNIGLMLKEHFTASQFIIVSLKDGMFNNANVLFRTKFVDGMSSVQRTTTRR